MSGFGGFGSPPPPFGAGFNTAPAPSFGQAPAASNNPFGRSSTFGGAPAPALTFGTSPNVPFGSSSGGGFGEAPVPTSSFGSAPFGSSSTGFGGPASSVSSSSSGFAPVSSGFGVAPAPPLGFGAPSSGFGTPAPAAGFGSPAPATGLAPGAPFGGAGGFGAPSSAPFGAPAASGAISFGTSSTTFAAPVSGFGQSSSAPFGAAPASNPFGGASSFPFGSSNAPPAPPVSFGMSSNIVHGNDESMASSSPTPYADTSMSPRSPMPDQSFSTPSFAAPASLWSGTNQGPFGSRPLGSIPEAADVSSMPATPFGRAPVSSSPFGAPEPAPPPQEDQKLADLKAKIEEKKRRLLEQKKRKEAATRSRSTSPEPDRGTSSLAQRNAIRFAAAANASTQERLPEELRTAQTSTKTSTLSSMVPGGTATERETLADAKSLVGTCPYMCPDEELLRRERESDIQMLEIPRPGELHPEGWTLRQTVVKRFRRSAADYKLDVPEWVRPPDVLEQVCGYLEEWVMERDRQGPDPRFPNNATPPPLDVYQFIWDRTRMVRKDFILQNYVGTGGKCDARAVRCHERIARWHTMCEHQLSHIPDFVTMQSQQNIQELGQTMKTLNQYYDDSKNRSLVEEADDDGNEMRKDISSLTHGCSASSVQGKAPVDYDGSALANENDPALVSSRLIGKEAAQLPHHGTAEPEMRGLYILLTIDNDGGMEVLKYVASLYQKRPVIYQSRPVQLALSIYKAKREKNYAKFFSILRDPKTPYLFSCIMFKHVELMRKSAFIIMSKTYGGRSREKNEAIYDAYPLKHLARLLCFESLEEAKAACKHYNITVKESTVRTSRGESVEDIIFWRHTSFKEPMDPDKGTVIPLPPQKMKRTIESKLNGATKLAVCRGQVSGEGAFLTPEQVLLIGSARTETPEELQRRMEAIEAARVEEQKRRELLAKKEREALEQEMRRKEEERVAAAKQHQEEMETQKAEDEKKKKEFAWQRQREKEERERQERLRLEEERERRRVEAEQAAARRKLEDEERKRREEQEVMEAARLAEQTRIREEQERVRQAEEERKRAAERERQRLEREEMERRRQEEEAHRQEELRRTEEHRMRQEAEESRLQAVWAEKTSASRKKLFWRRWMLRFPRHLHVQEQMCTILDNLDSVPSPLGSIGRLLKERPPTTEKWLAPPDLRGAMDVLLRDDREYSLADMVHSALAPVLGSRRQTVAGGKVTLLLSVAILLPKADNHLDRSLVNMIGAWLCKRFGTERVLESYDGFFDVRIAFVDGRAETAKSCDAGLVVLPPPWCDGDRIVDWSSNIDRSCPTTVLALSDNADRCLTDSDPVKRCAATFGTTRIVRNEDLEPDTLESALFTALHQIGQSIVAGEHRRMEKFPIKPLGVTLAQSVVVKDFALETRDEILEHVKKGLDCLVDELEKVAGEQESRPMWPADQFADKNGYVPNYFAEGQHLPLDWTTTLRHDEVDLEIEDLNSLFSGSVFNAIDALLHGAPKETLDESRQMLDRRLFQLALEHALRWREQSMSGDRRMQCVYLPFGMVGDILRRALHRLDENSNPLPTGETGAGGADDSFLEVIDSPPIEAESPEHLTPYTAFPMNNIRTTKRDRTASKDQDQIQVRLEFEQSPKRTRRQQAPPQALSAAVEESVAFTKKLESYLNFGTKEMLVGNRPLSSLLRGAPRLDSTDFVIDRHSYK